MGDATRSENFSSSHDNDAHPAGAGDHGRGFVRMVADRVVGVVGPASVLDVGCGQGLLVHALREKGVDATGLDVSEQAVEAAHPDVREHLRVASATEQIDGRYELVTCIGVLEHMAPAQAQEAIDRIAEVTDRVLFSSSPSDHREPTRVNGRPTDQWLASFAERGFYRRTDVDLSFVAPWAVLLERTDLTPHQLVQRYEARLTAVMDELVEKRAALPEAGRTSPVADQQAGVEEWKREVLEARHALLVNRDHVVGVEAEIGRLNQDVIRLTGDLNTAKRRVSALTKRKDGLSEKVERLRAQLSAAQSRNQRLDSRVAELEKRPQGSDSFARRVARRVRGGAR